MRISEGVEWGLHSAVLLATLPQGAALPTGRLAEFHGVPAAYLAKHLQAMSRAGLLDSVPGARGGYRLAKPAADVTVLDVVEAVDGAQPAFRCTEIRRRGPAALGPRAYRVPCSIHQVMDRADAAWRADLARTSIADLVAMVAEKAPPAGLQKGAAWLTEVLSR
ncbi:MAG TPA: Rrf2 family transcriptional regulator [Acidimicrobiia bacterium]|nr:Rrf2 family transcriptional regulator [Acidimicrobiia bacterium]